MPDLNRWSPWVLSLLRVIVGLLFMEHGLIKLFGFPSPLPGGGGPLSPMITAAGWIEFVGGGLIAVGLLTRAAAFICSGEMAAAYFIAHAEQSFFPSQNQGEPALFYCFTFFYLVFAGGGAISIDALVRRKT